MIGDEADEPSRAGTPANMDEKASLKVEEDAPMAAGSVNGSENGREQDVTSPSPELPADVRTKLRKLEKLEARYQGMFPQPGQHCNC